MSKVTAFFRDRKVSDKFNAINDAIEFRDDVAAHYPFTVTFRKVISMREWVHNCWNVVMDHNTNPLKNIPDLNTRHMIMQVLAWMWCIVFGIIAGSMWAGVVSMMLHALLLAAVAITVATFEVAKRKPYGFYNGRGLGGEHE